MKVDRNLQFQILERLKQTYPFPMNVDARIFFEDIAGSVGNDTLIANLLYLEEHGLLKSGLIPTAQRTYGPAHTGLIITAKGIDFLEGDGGLSAILNCVTVRIHDETLARIAKFLEQSQLPEDQKKELLSRLRELPFDATKHLVCKLLDVALDKVPDALQLVQKLIP